MHILKQVVLENGIGTFPIFKDKLIHGFSWGKDAKNMSFTFSPAQASEILKRNQEFFNKLSLGRVNESVVLIPEHRTRIIDLDKEYISKLPKRAKGKQVTGDAIFTPLSGQTISVKPADCTTALIYATGAQEEMMGIVHSGWRSTDRELPTLAIKHLVNKHNYKPHNIYIGITPHISKENRTYENLNQFTQADKWKDYITHDGALYHFDEGGCALQLYLDSGVPKDNIEIYEIDTYKEAKIGNTFSQKLAYNLNRDGEEYEDGRYIMSARL